MKIFISWASKVHYYVQVRLIDYAGVRWLFSWGWETSLTNWWIGMNLFDVICRLFEGNKRQAFWLKEFRRKSGSAKRNFTRGTFEKSHGAQKWRAFFCVAGGKTFSGYFLSSQHSLYYLPCSVVRATVWMFAFADKVFLIGHEASFIMFLCCLWRLQVLSKSDAVAVVTKVFRRYVLELYGGG